MKWNLQPSHSPRWQYWINGEAGTPIADVREHPNVTQNARIMTAAPELLDALENLLDLAERHIDQDAVQTARAAIAQGRAAIRSARNG